MTKEGKDNITRTAVAAAISTICASLILSIIFGFTGDNQKLKEELKTKASIPYVDQKCLDVKTDIENTLQNQNTDIREIRSDVKELLKMQIENQRK